MFRNLSGAIQTLEDGFVGVLVSRLRDGLVLQANQAFLNLTGYSGAEVIGFTASARGFWAGTGARDRMLEVARRQGHCFNLPVELRHKSGAIRHTSCSALVIDILNEPHLLTVVHDPQEAATFKDALAEESSRLDQIEETGGIGFWNMDSVSGEVHWSYGMEVIYGLPRGGFKGTAEDFITRIHPDDAARNLQESQAAIRAKKTFDIRFRIHRPDGSERWVVSRGAPRFRADGAFVGASGYQIDITDQVQRDLHLRLQSQVINNMAEGVLIVSAGSARILYANPCFEQMLGYAAGALEGLAVVEINGRSAHDPVAVANAIMAALHRHGVWRGEVRNRCADGSELWTRCTVSELEYESSGKVWVSVHTDINEERLAQQARDKALLQLQRQSLRVQDSIEEERLAVSREVHDQLGAALTGMRMKLESIATRLRGQNPEIAAEVLEVFENARQMQLAARDICTRLRPALLDDVGLAEACRWYVRDWSQQTGIAVRTRISRLSTTPQAHIETDMFRVMQELLTNVAKHAEAKNVSLHLSGGKSSLKLRVQDDGRGFGMQQEGAGFGLMGIRERVRHHHGALQIESGDTGTTMTATMQFAPLP